MGMNEYKQPTDLAIQAAANALMRENGMTTSLEVKQRMRDDGYWVDQEQVRDALSRMAGPLNWRVSTGRFRTYEPASLTEYQQEILSRLRDEFKDRLVDVGRGDRLIVDGVDVTGGVIISDVRGLKEYDKDVRHYADEVRRAISNQVNDKFIDDTSTKTGSVSISWMASLLGRLFGIYKQAISPGSHLVDLGITPTQQQDLANAIEREMNVDVHDHIYDQQTVTGLVDVVNKNLVSTASGVTKQRTKVNIKPKLCLSFVTLHDALTSKQVTDNDWLVWDVHNPSKRTVYDGSETRDHVRCAFAKFHGIRIQDTRSMRIYNDKFSDRHNLKNKI